MKFLQIILLSLVAVAIAEVTEVTEEPEGKCAEARRRSIENKAHVKIIFECEDKDNFKGLQCYHNSKFCSCYSSDGAAITTASTKIRRCECMREVDIQSSKGEDVYMPTCEDDGAYTPKQCDSTTEKCWCVDSDGKSISEPTTGELDC